MAPTTEKCPWCGSIITHDRFVKIQAQIRDEERRKLAEQERSLKKQLLAALELERAKMAKQAAAVKEQAEKQRLKEITETRSILQKELEKALLKKDADFARERAAFQKKIGDMSRQMQKKSTGELAEGADLDLFEELRGAFPDDQTSRLRTRFGGDILHEVRYKGKTAGKILVDARARGAWQHAFVTKLRQHQTELAADHAILSTPVFPAGQRELFVDSGVIVVAPARVVMMVEVLRKALISMHRAKLGDAERADKLDQLFQFITSPAFRKKLTEAETLTSEALQLDVDEKRAHDNVWKKRGALLMRMKHVLRDIDTDVSGIVEGKAEAKEDARLNNVAAMTIRTPRGRG